MGAALDESLVSKAAKAQCWIDYWFHFFKTKKGSLSAPSV
jgi:hypothetical protein